MQFSRTAQTEEDMSFYPNALEVGQIILDELKLIPQSFWVGAGIGGIVSSITTAFFMS